MNKGTLGGIGIAVSGIAAGLLLEHGQVAQMLQPTAALIVFGGTLGAVMVQFPFSVVMQAATLSERGLCPRRRPSRAID